MIICNLHKRSEHEVLGLILPELISGEFPRLKFVKHLTLFIELSPQKRNRNFYYNSQ